MSKKKAKKTPEAAKAAAAGEAVKTEGTVKTAGAAGGQTILTNLTQNPIDLAVEGVRVTLAPGKFKRVSADDLKTLMKNPQIRRMIEKEVIRATGRKVDEDLVDSASEAKAPASLTAPVQQGTVKAEVTKLAPEGAVDLGGGE